MNRKILAGAMALALPLSIVGVTAAGAKAKTPKPPKPVITGAALSAQAPAVNFSEGTTAIAPYQTATLTITGTNLPTSGVTAASIVAKVKGKGAYGLNSTTFKSVPFTVNSITSDTSTSIVASVEGPINNSLLYSLKKGYEPGAISLTVAGIKVPTTLSIQSNCGSTLPAVAAAGNSYGTTPDGAVDVAGGSTGSAPGLTYFDVSISTTGNALCADDIGSATSSGFPAYAANYPVQFSSAGHSASSISGIGFSFPYTTARTLSVASTVITYQLNNYKKGAVCTAGTQTNSSIHAGHVSCSVSGKGLVTVSDTADTLTYHQGDTIVGPVVNITGLTKKAAGSPITLTPTGDTSTIALGALNVGILFAPRAASTSATYAALATS